MRARLRSQLDSTAIPGSSALNDRPFTADAFCIDTLLFGTFMTSDKDETKGSASQGGEKDRNDVNRQKKDAQPGWANGLRQLYDSVVEEELPDSFKDLLSKLDGKN